MQLAEFLENNNSTLDFTTTFKSSVENDYTVYAYVDNEIQKVNVNVKILQVF